MSANSKTSLLPELSITILLLALAIFFSWQLSLSGDLKEKVAEAKEQRHLLIEQSNDLQTKTSEQLETFLSDLLELAETDAQAAALVQGYKIRRNAPAEPEAEK